MARKSTKKQPEAPQVNIGAEIFASLRELEKIKGIPVDYMVERLKQALTNAYRKDREDHRDIPGENVVVNISETGLTMHQIKTVVDELTDLALEIHIDAARRMNPDLKVGDTVAIAIDIQKFGRIAAQTAKQVVIQGIREAERGVMYESYSSKAQELLTGTILRIDPTSGDMFVRIGQGNEQSDAVLRASEQIPGEKHVEGEKIDIVVWSEDPCQYVKAALSPADVVSVSLVPGQKACRVIVPEDQLSLAIGKEGQNARLAARLTGYKIDIKPASQAEE